MDNELIRAKLLFSLARKRKWGASHTDYENMFRQFKTESLGKLGMKYAKNVAEELVKERFLIKKTTSYGLHVSLNPNKAIDIKQLIKNKLGFDL